MDIYLAEAFGKIVDVMRKNNFESNAIDCTTSMNGTDLASVSKPKSIVEFEEALNEHVATTRMLQMYKNSTTTIEYYAKVSVFGRDGNEMPIVSDESPILTELALIDHSQFSLTPNVSLTAPRRFFRIGIGQVIFYFRDYKSEDMSSYFDGISSFAESGFAMVIYEIGSENVNATARQ